LYSRCNVESGRSCRFGRGYVFEHVFLIAFGILILIAQLSTIEWRINSEQMILSENIFPQKRVFILNVSMWLRFFFVFFSEIPPFFYAVTSAKDSAKGKCEFSLANGVGRGQCLHR